MRMLLLLVLCWAATASATGIVRCTDPATGAVTFSDRACPKGGGEQVRFHSGNAASSAHLHARRAEAEDAREYAPQRPANTQRATAAQERLCREAAQPYKGSQGGLTAAQRNVLANCAGAAAGSPANPTPPPTVITGCDAAGCWDNQGGRYSKAAGSTYFGPGGRSCQLIGGQMQCP